MKATDDQRILELFAARDEAALRQLSQKYGTACRKIAVQILGCEQDAEEVLNDALWRLWNAIPPQKPDDLYKYLTTTVRRLAYQRVRGRKTRKRGGGLAELPLDSPAAQQSRFSALRTWLPQSLLHPLSFVSGIDCANIFSHPVSRLTLCAAICVAAAAFFC